MRQIWKVSFIFDAKWLWPKIVSLYYGITIFVVAVMRCGIIHWLSLDKIVLMKGVYKRNEWLSVWPQLTILCSAKCIIITYCVRHQTLFCWSQFGKHCKDMRRLLCILYQSLPKHQVPQIFTFYMQLGIIIFYKYYINF